MEEYRHWILPHWSNNLSPWEAYDDQLKDFACILIRTGLLESMKEPRICRHVLISLSSSPLPKDFGAHAPKMDPDVFDSKSLWQLCAHTHLFDRVVGNLHTCMPCCILVPHENDMWMLSCSFVFVSKRVAAIDNNRWCVFVLVALQASSLELRGETLGRWLHLVIAMFHMLCPCCRHCFGFCSCHLSWNFTWNTWAKQVAHDSARLDSNSMTD